MRVPYAVYLCAVEDIDVRQMRGNNSQLTAAGGVCSNCCLSCWPLHASGSTVSIPRVCLATSISLAFKVAGRHAVSSGCIAVNNKRCMHCAGIIMTEAGVYDNSSAATQAACRTDQTDVLKNTPWFRCEHICMPLPRMAHLRSSYVLLTGYVNLLVLLNGYMYLACAPVSSTLHVPLRDAGSHTRASGAPSSSPGAAC